MERKRKLVIAKTAVVMGTIPLMIWAHSSGPDVGATAAPGEQTCSQARCHVGTNVNAGGGSVQVAFPSGLTYSPGVKQHLVVTVSDPTARVWGFQLTARVASAQSTMAGTFKSTDNFTALLCLASPADPDVRFSDTGPNQACPANKPLAYVEHTSVGAARIKTGSQTYEFDWTPPATNVGDIRIFVSGNAANGNGNESGDKIYNTSYTLTPAAAGGAPSITTVQNGASFQSGISPNSWMTIKGTNLSATTNTWEKAIVDGKLPTSLDGVTVSVGGKPAYIYYVSPEQINALAPDVGAGSMAVSVGSASAATTASVVMPAFFPWPENQVVATRIDGSYVAKFSGATPARPGDVVILWGTGFGPTNPPAPVGSVSLLTVQYNVASPVSVTVGGTPAEFIGAALAPGFVGLYQIAIRIPANAPNGDLPVVATVAGAQSPAGATIAVQR